jgi:hypothetical protein
MANPTLAYSISEACSRAQSGRTALYSAIKSGALVARKRGTRTLILHEDLCRYLQSLPRFATKCDLQSKHGACHE